MSQYATPEQLQALSLTPASYGRFTQDATGAAGKDLSAVNANLQAASDRCDLDISSQLVLPLSKWGMALTKATCDIAAYYLYVQFGFNPNAIGDKNIHMRYEEAIQWLTKVSRKELHLDSNPSYVDASAGTPAAGPTVLSNPQVGFAGNGWNCGGNGNGSNGGQW